MLRSSMNPMPLPALLLGLAACGPPSAELLREALVDACVGWDEYQARLQAGDTLHVTAEEDTLRPGPQTYNRAESA
ncbi:hypothetical protein BH24GEM3_BH24GEM3_02120 [soil metagenome]